MSLSLGRLRSIGTARYSSATLRTPFHWHPDRSIPFPKGMECEVEGPAVAVTMGIAVIALLALIAGTPSVALAQKPALVGVIAALPEGAMQAKATTACTECHEARIILQQRLSKAAWTKEVDKMTKWGALVDAADRDALIDYLSSNFSPGKPAYEAPRTADQNGKMSR
jgi:cytochrome c553